SGPEVPGPVDYYLLGRELAGGADRASFAAAIAERGREAGAALGDDPRRSVAQLAGRVTDLVDATPDDAPVAIRGGRMTLANYLPTRTFELAVHGLDLARALGTDAPSNLMPAVSASCELAGLIAARLPSAPDFLLLLAGRQGLPAGLSVV